MKRQGFTLIEIIVVISIISLLSIIGLTTYNRVQTSARDTRRIADMQEIKTSLLLYKSINKVFPGNADSDCSGWDTSGDNNFIPALESTGLIENTPTDPLGDATDPCAGHGSTAGHNYFYYRYTAAQGQVYGCPQNKPFMVVGVSEMETSGGPHPKSPGFSCTNRDWHATLDYVIGIYE